MSSEDYQEVCIQSITSASVEYARSYIKQADIGMLEEALRRIEGREATKTLRKAIEARLRKLRKEAGVVSCPQCGSERVKAVGDRRERKRRHGRSGYTYLVVMGYACLDCWKRFNLSVERQKGEVDA